MLGGLGLPCLTSPTPCPLLPLPYPAGGGGGLDRGGSKSIPEARSGAVGVVLDDAAWAIDNIPVPVPPGLAPGKPGSEVDSRPGYAGVYLGPGLPRARVYPGSQVSHVHESKVYDGTRGRPKRLPSRRVAREFEYPG